MHDLPAGCRMVSLSVRGDDRGSLVALEQGREVPFDIMRAYYIFGTEAGVARGFHAHRDLRQMAIAVRGSCRMKIDDGKHRAEVMLNQPAKGLLLGSLIWREMHDFSDDCVLLVLADRLYDESDYIRSYDEFLEAARLPR